MKWFRNSAKIHFQNATSHPAPAEYLPIKSVALNASLPNSMLSSDDIGYKHTSLMFFNPIDEDLFIKSQRQYFNFPTILPIMISFLAFLAFTTFTSMGKNIYSSLSLLFLAIEIALVTVYVICQMIENGGEWYPMLFRSFARRSLYNKIDDIILVVATICEGFSILSISTDNQRDKTIINFKIYVQILMGYAAILFLSFFLKTTKRYWILTNWFIYSFFYIISNFIFFSFKSNPIFFIVVSATYLLTLYENERHKMKVYVVGKKSSFDAQKKLAKIDKKTKDIEKKLSRALVNEILPPKVVEAIQAGKPVLPESFEEVTIFFSDVVGFTSICSQVEPNQVVTMLNELYTVMDYCTKFFPLYKVETIGDAYMVVGGLPTRDPRHAQYVANFALLVRHAVQQVKSPVDGSPINIRIGLHSGAVMAGVVGNLMPRYCLFGDAVNTASRMESNGQPGFIHCSAATADILLKTGKYVMTKRGDIEIKGKGIMTTYWLNEASTGNVDANQDALQKLDANVYEIRMQYYREQDIELFDLEPSPITIHEPYMNTTYTTNFSCSQDVGNIQKLLKHDSFEDKKVATSPKPFLHFEEKEVNHTVTTAILTTTEHDIESGVHVDYDTSHDNFEESGNDFKLITNENLELPSPSTFNLESTSVSNSSPYYRRIRSMSDVNDYKSVISRLDPKHFLPNLPTEIGNIFLNNDQDNTTESSPLQNNLFPHQVPSKSHSNTTLRYSAEGKVIRRHHSWGRGIESGVRSRVLSNPNTNKMEVNLSFAKILVVEDSPPQRKIMMKKFKDADSTWEISCSADGEQALQILRASKNLFDIIVVDQNLSSNDGLFGHELVEVLRKKYKMVDCVIIACTSNAAKVKDDLLAAGVDCVWSKPLPAPAVIKTKIEELIIQKVNEQKDNS